MLVCIINTDFEQNRFKLGTLISSFEDTGDLLFQERNTIKKFKIDDQSVVIKSFKIPSILNQFIYRYFRKSKAWRSYYNSLVLVKKGINTPRPLAFLEQKNIFNLTKSYYISENVAYDFTFRELIDNQYTFDQAEWRVILQQFTNFSYFLHQKDVLHLDYSPGNILIRKETNGYLFYLVDNNRMKFNKSTIDVRLNNLTKLSLTQEMITIVAKQYAIASQINETIVLQKLIYYASKFEQKKEQKKRLKGLIGK